MIKKLVQKIETYVKTDIRYIVNGGFWSASNYGLQVSAGVITTVALANALSPESLGTYQYILAVSSVLSVLTLSGLGTAITRAVAQGIDGVLRSGFYLKLRWSILAGIIGILLSTYYLIAGDMVLGFSFLVIAACIPLLESFKLYENYLQGKQAFKDTVFLGFWRKPLPVVAILVALWFTDSVLVLITTYFVANLVSYAAVYLAVIKKYQPSKYFDLPTYQLSKHLSALKIMAEVGSHADKILIWHFLGAAEVAIYTIAQLAVRYSGGFLSTINSILLPKVSQRDLRTLQQTLPRKVLFFTASMALGVLLYIIAAPHLFKILFPQYPEAVIYSQILAFTLLLTPRTMFAQVLTAHKQVAAQYKLTVINLTLKLTFLAMLLPIFGIWGAVYSVLTTETILLILTFYYFFKAK